MSLEFGKKELQPLLDAMPDAILIMNSAGNIDFVNMQLEIMFGYSKDELIGRSVEILLPEHLSEIHKVHRTRFLSEPKVRPMGQGTDLKLMGRRKNGSEFPLEISLSSVTMDGSVFVIAAVRNVTRRKQLEEELHEKETQLRTINNNLPNGYTYQVDLGEQGELQKFIYISDGVEKIFGISAHQILEDSTKLSERFLDEDNDRVAQMEKLALASMSIFKAEVRFHREGTQVGWMFLSSTPRKLANNHIVWDGVALEITELKNAQEELQRLARTDPLTGLFNRRHFFEIAQQEMIKSNRYNRPLSLILFDIDLFKTINDTYGHMAGDQILTKIGELLGNKERTTDVVARYGGEEFIILMPETDLKHAEAAAQRLRKLVGKISVQIDGSIIRLTGSFGVAVKDAGNEDTLEHLISQADLALYEAKKIGRNRVVRRF